MKPHAGGRPTEADKLILLERRKRVSAAYVRGRPQWEIAQAEKVDRSTISHDLAAIRKEWLASALLDFDARKAQELARLDAVESEAWAAWERSCKPRERSRAKKVEGGTARTEGEKVTEGRDGNPKWLDSIRAIIELRCRILGVLAPTKFAPTTPDGQPLPVVGIAVIQPPEPANAQGASGTDA